MKDITERWLVFVDNDLNLVRAIVTDLKHKEVVVFHLQQALEKIIKAYIQEIKDIEPPKIHNLSTLIDISSLNLNNDDLILLQDLNRLYVESRYPDNIKELEDYLTKEKIEELYNFTERLVLWIRNKLSSK